MADRDLAAALRRDDEREEQGMAPADRETCHQCQSWADHAHDLLTGRRMSIDEWETQRRELLGLSTTNTTQEG